MQNKIQTILDKHKLTVIEYIRKPDGGIIRSHVIKCADEQGQTLALKVFDSEDKLARARFLDELRHVKAISAKLPSNLKSFLPKIKYFELEGDNPFYIYKFYEGNKLGSFIKDFGIGHGNFSHANFAKFINFIDVLSDVELSEDYKLSRWSQNNARKELKYYLENTPELFNPELYDRIINFYEDKLPQTFKNFNYSHRDLYPENIIIEKQFSSRFIFLDWEYFSKVPLGFNAAFLYLMFWREEFWKAKVFSHFYNKYEDLDGGKYLHTFLESFSFCLVILAIRFLYQIQAFSDKGSDVAYHAERSFLFDLDRALKGDIIKPRNVKFYVEQRDIEKVARNFGLEGVKEYEIFYASKGNTVAKVVLENGLKYIFRFYSDSRTRELIKRELKIFEKLRSSDIKSYQVLRTSKNKDILDINLYGKNRRVAVLSYLEGKKILRKWADATSVKNLANLLRSIHSCDVVHGDFSKENVLFKRNKIAGIIDFEWGRFTKSKEVKRHDMAKAIALWLTDIRYKNIPDEDFFELFVKAYYQRELSVKEKCDILDLVSSKIQTEKDIFVTTIDMSYRKSNVRRFDDILKKLTKLKLSYKA